MSSTDRTRRAARAVTAADLDVCCDSLIGELGCLEGRRVLLTGGGGFLGYYLVQTLLAWNQRTSRAKPIDVTVLDNYVRGLPTWLGELRDEHLRLVAHDVTRPVPNDLGQFDYVVHAASIASPTFYRRNPIATMDANVTGLRLLLEHARRQQENGHPVAGFLFFSSSEIYWRPGAGGDPDAGNVPGPRVVHRAPCVLRRVEAVPARRSV